MADLTIKADPAEEMVGSGHATKADTLNRLVLGGATATLRDVDGKILYSLFKEQLSNPSTGADEIALFCKDDGSGNLKLYWRDESNGAVSEIGSNALEYIEIINWTRTFTGDASGTDTETITNTVDPNTTIAIPIFNGVIRGSGTDFERFGFGCEVTDTDELTIDYYYDKGGTPNWAASAWIAIVSFNSLASLQLFNPDDANNITISSVDTDKAFIIPCGNVFGGMGAAGWYDARSYHITAAATVTLDRQYGTGDHAPHNVCQFAVIEHN